MKSVSQSEIVGVCHTLLSIYGRGSGGEVAEDELTVPLKAHIHHTA